MVDHGDDGDGHCDPLGVVEDEAKEANDGKKETTGTEERVGLHSR